jgi:hypothetical protein
VVTGLATDTTIITLPLNRMWWTPSRMSAWPSSWCAPTSAPTRLPRARRGTRTCSKVRLVCPPFPSFLAYTLSDTLFRPFLTPPHPPLYLSTHADPAAAEAANAGPGGLPNPIPQRLLTKYIMYARSNVRPQINDVDQDKIERLYVDLRRESKQCGGVRACLFRVSVREMGAVGLFFFFGASY